MKSYVQVNLYKFLESGVMLSCTGFFVQDSWACHPFKPTPSFVLKKLYNTCLEDWLGLIIMIWILVWYF